MDIIFNENPGLIVDFIYTIHSVYNRNLEEELSKYNLTLKKDLKKIYEFFIKNIDVNHKGLDFYFKDGYDAFLMFYSGKEIWRLGTIDNFLKALKECPADSLRKYLLEYLSGHQKDEKSIEKLLTDNKSAMDFIRGLDKPDSVKWNAIDFLSDPRQSLLNIMDFIEDFADKYIKVHEKNIGIIDEFNLKFSNELKEKGDARIEEVCSGMIEVAKYKRAFISTTFFCSYVLMAEDGGEEDFYIFLGRDYEETLAKISGKDDEERALAILKAISDPTRYKIISLLSSNTYYGQELADRLNLSLATISHHMEMLCVSARVVKIEVVGNKVYYSLNKEALEKCVGFIKNRFGLKGE